CHRHAREIPVLRYVRDPRWFPTLQHPTWQARSGNEVGGLGHAPKRLEPFGVVEVPTPRGNQLPVGQQIGVPDRPSGVPAELIERQLQHAFGALRLVGSAGDHLANLQERRLFAQRLLGPLELGDLGVDADRAAVLGLALVDLDPAAVALTVQERSLWVVMQFKSLLDPLFVSVGNTRNDATLGHGPSDLLERDPRHNDIGKTGVKLPEAVVADHQPVFGIEQKEALRDALEGVGQLLAGLRNLAEVALLDFDRGVAEHAERLSHSADLVVAIPARDADRRVARGEATHGYRDSLERPDNPWHHVVEQDRG